MKKVIWSVQQFQSNRSINIENVVSATLSNFSDEPMTFEVNGVKRTIPAFDKGLNFPVAPFKIEITGYTFDLNIKVTFGTGLKNLIIDYAKIKDC